MRHTCMRYLLVPAMLAAVVSCGTTGRDGHGQAALLPGASPSQQPTVASGGQVSGEARVTQRATQRGTATPVVVTPASSVTRAATTSGKLTEQSSGQTVRLKRGARLEVSLPGGSAGGYAQPASSDASVLARTASSGGYPTEQPARAVFVAVGAGTADLTSTTDFTCLHAHPSCLPPQRAWHVRVIVS